MRFYGANSIHTGGEQEDPDLCICEVSYDYRHQCRRTKEHSEPGHHSLFCWQHGTMAIPFVGGGWGGSRSSRKTNIT